MRMSSESSKQQLLACFAMIAKGLAHQHRLDLLEQLGQGERSVERLAEHAGLSIANTSQHVQRLRRAGLVAARRQGKHVFYRLADESVVMLLTALRRIGERTSADVESVIAGYFRQRDRLEPIPRAELLRRMRAGLVTVIDVRPDDEYRQGHLPGSINLPLSELTRLLESLPRDQAIIAYCRGPYCVLAFEAVAALRARGFEARRLEDGFPEWKAAGLPVKTG